MPLEKKGATTRSWPSSNSLELAATTMQMHPSIKADHRSAVIEKRVGSSARTSSKHSIGGTSEWTASTFIKRYCSVQDERATTVVIGGNGRYISPPLPAVIVHGAKGKA